MPVFHFFTDNQLFNYFRVRDERERNLHKVDGIFSLRYSWFENLVQSLGFSPSYFKIWGNGTSLPIT